MPIRQSMKCKAPSSTSCRMAVHRDSLLLSIGSLEAGLRFDGSTICED